jgi:soluble lytic murein transglycosylase-like protein
MAALSTSSIASADQDSRVCEEILPAVAESEQVPLAILLAVGLTETGKNGVLHPFALNVEGETIITNSKAEALRAFEKAQRDGKILIDLGCMQVNYHYHGSDFSSAAEMLDPEKNIVYAARLLKSLKETEGSWTAAVARYHASPKNRPAQHSYICTVIANLSASGFGSWTPQARSYCGRK